MAGSELFVWAGYDGETPFDDLYVLHLDTLMWSSPQMTGTIPSAREGHSAVLVGSDLFVFAGANGEEWFNDLHILDKDQLSWSTPSVQGSVPLPREGHSAVLSKEQGMIVFGGTDGTQCFNDVHVLNTDTLKWSEVVTSGEPPAPRVFHSATLLEGRMVIFSGHDGETKHDDVQVLDLVTMTWQKLNPTGVGPSARLCHSATRVSSQIFFVGGFDGTDLKKEVFVLQNLPQPLAQSASPLPTPLPPPVPPPSVKEPAAETPSNQAEHASQPPTFSEQKAADQEQEHRQTAVSWSSVHAGSMHDKGSPVGAIAFHTATYIPSWRSLLVFGGQTSEAFVNSVQVFDTKKQQWDIPSIALGPKARAMHSAVLTDDERLVIFGGFSGEFPFGDTWILHTTDKKLRWEQSAVEGEQPMARQGHCAVWYENVMYVFGGSDGNKWFSDLNALHVYQDGTPLRWSQPRALGRKPSAREGHACTVQNGILFIHGGTNAGETVADLHQLNLRSTVWMQPQVTGTIPAARSFHTLLSLGSWLLLWGGYNGTLASSEVLALDTKSKHWRQLASVDAAPMQRFCHAAAQQDDSSFLIFGGFDGENHLEDFARLQLHLGASEIAAQSEAASASAFQVASERRSRSQLETMEEGLSDQDRKLTDSHDMETPPNEHELHDEAAAAEMVEKETAKEAEEKAAEESQERDSISKLREAKECDERSQKAQDKKVNDKQQENKAGIYRQERELAEKKHRDDESQEHIELFQKRSNVVNKPQTEVESPAVDTAERDTLQGQQEVKDSQRQVMEHTERKPHEVDFAEAAAAASLLDAAASQAAARQHEEEIRGPHGTLVGNSRLEQIEKRLDNMEKLMQQMINLMQERPDK